MGKTKVLQTDFFGDDNIGLFSAASDRLCVVGRWLPEGTGFGVERVLGVPVSNATVAGSEVVGIFCAMNSSGILLPKIARKDELAVFRGLASEGGMSVGVLQSNFTAVGNLVLCNDSGAVVSGLLSPRDRRVVSECLDVEVVVGKAAGLESVGSCGIATNRGCVVHRDAAEDELDCFQDALKVESDVGTANFGSPFVGSCAIANGNGTVIGDATTGPEAARIMETLGLL